jgi:membrane-bound lytic murein transglycosylase D
VDKGSDIDVALAAQLAEMSVDEFKALNPQFKKPVITGDDTKILLPKENAEKFHINLAQWGHALSTWTTHKITGAKETMASLASKFHTTPQVIRQANNIPASSRLKAGSTILVPKTSASSGDIAESVIETAQVSFEADHRSRTQDKQSGTQRYKPRSRHKR